MIKDIVFLCIRCYFSSGERISRVISSFILKSSLSKRKLDRVIESLRRSIVVGNNRYKSKLSLSAT